MGEFVNPELVPKVKFYTGEEVPCIGLGTFGSDRVSAEDVAKAVDGAIRSGYRNIDCAACYGNEDLIGDVLKNLLSENVVKRDELFVMTKVWNDMHREVGKALKKSLSDLKLDYVDMYYIHWPFPNYHAPHCDVDSRNPDSKPFSVEEFCDTYEQIAELKKEGLWFVCAAGDGDVMYDLNLKGPIGLVVGNEGKGVGRLVREACDYTAAIPMKGDIDSLNASVAAGILAYEIVRQRRL